MFNVLTDAVIVAVIAVGALVLVMVVFGGIGVRASPIG